MTTIDHTSNPVLKHFNTIHQTAPFRSIKIEHYLPAFAARIEQAKAEVQQIIDHTQAPNFENSIVALDLAGEQLNRIQSIFFNLNSAETDDKLQKIAQEISPKLSAYSNDILLNEKLFERIKYVFDHKDEITLSTEGSKLLEKTYKSFVRNGALLKDKDKENKKAQKNSKN